MGTSSSSGIMSSLRIRRNRSRGQNRNRRRNRKLHTYSIVCGTLPTHFATKQEAAAKNKCSICLGCVVENELMRKLPCGHEFHAHCLDPWLKKKNQCPNCRHLVDAPTKREAIKMLDIDSLMNEVENEENDNPVMIPAKLPMKKIPFKAPTMHKTTKRSVTSRMTAARHCQEAILNCKISKTGYRPIAQHFETESPKPESGRVPKEPPLVFRPNIVGVATKQRRRIRSSTDRRSLTSGVR